MIRRGPAVFGQAAGRPRLRSLAANTVGVLVLTLLHGGGNLLPASSTVSFVAWIVLYLVCVLAFIALATFGTRQWRTVDWLATAFYAALFAAIFYAANGAQDALHGPHRKGPNVGAGIGGLELWFVLCPGSVSVSMGCALRTMIRSAVGDESGGRTSASVPRD